VYALIANTLLLLLLPFRLLRRRRAAGKTGWVHLVVDGPLLDLPRPRTHWTELLKSRGQKQELNLHRLAEALDELAADPAAKGLLVTLRSAGGGAARMRSLRGQLERLRTRGKRVVVYLPHGASLRELGVACCADALWLDPAASIAPLGVAASIPYVRAGLDALGVEAEVLARGRYKTAAENLVRREMSEAQREQLGALLDDLFDDVSSALCSGRRVPGDKVAEWIEQSPWAARDALDRGLVDALVTDEQVVPHLLAWPERLAATAESDPDDAPRLVPLGLYERRRRVRLVPLRPRDYVAVVDVHGAIVSEARPGAAAAAEGPLVQALERARRDRRARAVVLHVDSRGGSALASARILRAVLRVRRRKPVVAYFCDVAASGGYMIGVGAQKIVAQPVTLTGSIGVVAAKPVVATLLERLGVRVETLKRGDRVDMLSPVRKLTDEERDTFTRELELTYDEFVRVVAEGRSTSEAHVRAVAEGRVWSGRAAQREGLVDTLGDFSVALAEANGLAGTVGLGPRRVRTKGWGGALGGGPSAGSWLSALQGLAVSRRGGGAEGAWAPWAELWRLAEDGDRVLAHCAVTIDPEGRGAAR
jgi:protease-4